MAYGERKNLRKQPGEYGFVDMMGLGLASAFGIAVATFFDLTQSDEGSALFVFNKWIATATSMLGLGDIPLYGVVLILMAVGGMSILYFQPVTFRGAFAQGFGVLAAIMTLAPSDLANPAPGPESMDMMEMMPAGDGEVWPDEADAEGISYQPAMAPVYAVPVATSAAPLAVQELGYSLRIKITFSDGLGNSYTDMIRNGSLRGRLHNETTNDSYNLFRNSSAGLMYRDDSFYISTRIPGDDPTATLVTRIEAEGYRIIESRFEAKQGVNPVWNIVMTPSGTPLFLQRLRKPYTF